jgi:hypothetical protein
MSNSDANSEAKSNRKNLLKGLLAIEDLQNQGELDQSFVDDWPQKRHVAPSNAGIAQTELLSLAIKMKRNEEGNGSKQDRYL